MHCVVVKHNEICGCENPVVSLLNTTQICRRKSLLYLMMSYCSTCCWEHDHNGKKPFAPIGKQVCCAVAPKTFVPLGTPTNYITLPWCNGDKRTMRACVARLHTMVAVLCLTRAWRQPRHASFRDKGSAWHGSNMWLVKVKLAWYKLTCAKSDVLKQKNANANQPGESPHPVKHEIPNSNTNKH